MRTFAYAALCGAAMGILLPAANAQEAPLTAAGDVTASEATPLPPLDVTAPSQPLNKPKSSKAKKSTASSASNAASAAGEGSEGDGKTGIFTLGQLSMIGGATVSNETMWTFNTTRLDEAAAIAPGVSMATYGGRRNERDVLVRGFDRWRVPLTMDGARIYLPADNRLDMNRFLTPDISEIQIQKGYVSVLNGPGGMGGSINLVSRKPTKEFETEARFGMVLDGDLEDKSAVTAYGRVGTRREEGYAQISGTLLNRDHWDLSNDFVSQSIYEDGGARNGSETKDYSYNIKVGYTPNATDEYAISFNSQAGEKGAPLHVKGENQKRYWTWPTWDISTLSGFTHTQIGEASYIKTNAYYNTLNNSLRSFDDITYTSQNAQYAFDSWYDDFAYGGSIEAGTDLIPMNTLKGALHYRLDNHKERNNNRPTNTGTTNGLPNQYLEAWQETEEKTWSVALENTFHATKWFDIVAGVSRDSVELIKAEEFGSAPRALYLQPTGEDQAWNWQSAAIMRYGDDGKVYASVSDRTRFPTIFERYSSRFGSALANPDLKSERARNYEVGWSDTLDRRLKLSSALFYTEISDYIDVVFIGNLRQNQNVGDGTHKGFEFSVDYDLVPGLRVGGNYTLLKRDITNPEEPSYRPTDTPEHEAFIYVAWDAMRNLTITPSLQLASDRLSAVTAVGTPSAPPTTYTSVGAYTLVNLNVEYRLNENVTTSFGGRNLTDEDYMLAEGYPEVGRQFYANVRAQF